VSDPSRKSSSNIVWGLPLCLDIKMEVHLLVYDLSRGLARQMSMGLLGFQLDAVYHTSILLDGLEYVYDGGIVAIQPGSSHLGQPIQSLKLGTTQLPMEIIVEYLESLRPIYTVEVGFT
jgi:desumoylating isopeptidase 1